MRSYKFEKIRFLFWDLISRIENMCYVIGVNRVGMDANGYEYNGHSVAYDSLGEQLTSPISNEEFIEIVTLNKDRLTDVRKKLNFLNDKDAFEVLK